MELTREMVEARIAELAAQREQKIADANALTGAIQDCEFWISEIERGGGDATVAVTEAA